MPLAEYELMFKGVQSIVQSSATISQGLERLNEFAASQYGDLDYWREVFSTELPLDVISSWAKEGLEALEAKTGWSSLMLDCGDAPELFNLADCRKRPDVSEARFTQASKATTVLSAGEFPLDGFESYRKLIYHSARELNHPILSWNTTPDREWHGVNGELLWLAIASLALCEPLRDAEYCRRILKGREAIYLMSGFEEIFFYVGTVTGRGLSFD